MKKHLIHIVILISAFTAAMVNMVAYAVSDGSDVVTTNVTTESVCTWLPSGVEGTNLSVASGEVCMINGTGKTALTVTVASGGTLLVGNLTTTDFTVTETATYNTTIDGIMNNAGTFATTGGGVLVDGGTLTSSNSMSIGGSGNPKVLELRDDSTLTTSGSGNIVIWGDMTVYDDSTWTNSSPNMILRKSLTMQKSATANSPDLINNNPGVITLKAASSGDYLYNDLNLYDDSTITNNTTATIEVMNDVWLGNSDADAAQITNDGNFYIGWDGSSTGTSDNTLRIRYDGTFTNQDDGILIVDKNETTFGDGRVMIYPNYDSASNTPQLLNYGSIEITTIMIGDVINRLSEFHNYSGGSFRAYYSAGGSETIDMNYNSTIENDSGSTLFQIDGRVVMAGSIGGSAIINNHDNFFAEDMYITDYSTVNNYSTLDIAPNPVDAGYLYMSGTSAQLTNYTGGTLNVYAIQVGAYTGTGATLTTEHNSQVSATTLQAIDPGIVDAAGQIDITGDLVINQGGTVTFKDPYSVESDIYEIGSLEIESPTSKTSTFTIGDSTTPYIRINSSHGSCAGGDYCSIEIGYDTGGGGSSELNINGTLEVVDTAQNANIEIGKYGIVNLADNKTLDVNETGGTFYIRGDGTNQGTATLDGDVDLSMPLNVSGDLNAGTTDLTSCYINIADTYTVGATGNVVQGLLSAVSVIGSTTTISGDYELDGLLDAGDDDGDTITITETGNVYSGVGTETRFYIRSHDFTIEEGGQIASDGVSEVPPDYQGGGSNGGEGAPNCSLSECTYGKTNLTVDDHPFYGQAGAYDGVGTLDANGGGGVRIGSTGSIVIDGTISANGADSNDGSGGAGAGGTIIIEQWPMSTDDVFTGISTAKIQANGGGTPTGAGWGGGGGRIAINSILYDDPADLRVGGEYGYDGAVEAFGGDSNAGAGDTGGAAGTIFLTGDENNPNGTLIVDNNNFDPDYSNVTEIANSGDFVFDRIEARNNGQIYYEVSPGTGPVSCFEVNGGYVDETTLGFDCDPFPDKPNLLYINNSVTGAQSGNEPSVNYTTDPLEVGDLTPNFSIVYANPEDSSAVTDLAIQIAEDTDNDGILFETSDDTFMWDTTITGLKDKNGGNITPGVQTRDIEYDEDDNADYPLEAGTTYYVRMAFFTGANQGLWSHRDIGQHYKFEINNYLSITPLCTAGAFSIMDFNHPTSKLMTLPGRRFGEGRCQIDFDPTGYSGTWYVGVGLASNETSQATAFNSDPDNDGNNIDPIDNSASGTCHMNDTGNGTVEQYAYNISGFSGSGDTIYTDTESGTDCNSSFQIIHENPASSWLFHDLEVSPGENVATGTSITDHLFYLNLFTSINTATVVSDYTLDITLLASSAP